MKTAICQFCKEEFDSNPPSAGKYCSRFCFHEARRQRLGTPAISVLHCHTCGKDYKPGHKTRPSRFCSHTCQMAEKKRQVLTICEYCGKERMRKASDAREARFCSHSCRAYALSVGKTIGVRTKQGAASNWAPHEIPDFQSQARKARKRDNYTCLDCGSKWEKSDRHLEVHHIVPRRLGGTNDLDNLVSLCSRCHRCRDYALRLRDGVPQPANRTRGPERR